MDIVSITEFWKLEIDPFYRKGEMKGYEKANKEKSAVFVKNLLLNTDFSVAKIASLVEVTEYFVKKIKRSLQ